MLLATRRFVLADFVEAREHLLLSYGTDPVVHASLPGFWRAGTEAGAFVGQISHEESDPTSPAFASFCMTMVARPEFVEHVLNSAQGGFGEHAVRWYMAARVPWLRAEEASRVSAESAAAAQGSAPDPSGGGVDVVGMHYAYAMGASMADNPPELLEAQNGSFFQLHRGIRFRSHHRTAITSDGLAWSTAIGMRYRPRPGENAPNIAPTPDKPAITGVRREELPLIWGTLAARIFTYYPPRLRLTGTHRELLGQALRGATDDEIAEALSVSVSAVKKRWIALYDHIDDVSPNLIGASDRSSEDAGRRGSERRRHLLNYLRSHPEELNPQAG